MAESSPATPFVPQLLRSVRAAKARTWAWLIAWALLAAAILAATAHIALTGVEPVEQFILERYLPERAWGTAKWLIEHFADAQIRAAIVTTTLTGGMLLVSVLLFPLKERASATFERDSQITAHMRWREPPLWRLGLEELWLLVLYGALSSLSFWIGYGGGEGRRITALVLTQLIMAFTLTVDYLAPAMQRHGWRYTQVVRQVIRRPGTVLAFGLCFGAPAILATQLLEEPAAHELTRNLVILVAVQLACLCGALWTGTIAGARICREVHQPSAAGLPITAHLATWGLMIFTALSLGSVARAAYRALPLLRCDYSLVPSSWSLGRGEGAGLRLSFELEIHNPTPWEAELEKHRIEIIHDGDHLAEAKLEPFTVPAGARERHPAAFELDAKAGLAKKGLGAALDWKRHGWRAAGKSLLEGATDTQAYAVTLYLPTPVMEFPIYLTEAAKPGAGEDD